MISPAPLAESRPMPPAPRLQITEGKDLKAFKAEEREALNGYGWVDKAGGTLHIPIDRAIEILAERGLPSREKKEVSS
jgi:hypothetical protein